MRLIRLCRIELRAFLMSFDEFLSPWLNEIWPKVSSKVKQTDCLLALGWCVKLVKDLSNGSINLHINSGFRRTRRGPGALGSRANMEIGRITERG